MKWSWFGRASMALLSAMALGLGMTACGGGTIAYMWTVGTQYNQIHGYKVDHYTGNLTAVQNSPFAANGSAPVDILVKPGGRYVYVVNQGTTTTSTTNSADSGIAVFSVGGDGALTYQTSYPTQGFKHIWAQFDTTGNYLFVLDQYSPSGDGNGAITVFTVNPDTGRLSVNPQTASVPAGAIAPLYLEVGNSPVRMAATSACLFTVNGADQTVTPYLASSGQLTPVTTGKITIGSTNATSINGNSTYMVITDAGAVDSTTGGYDANQAYIYPYTVTTGCGLTPFSGGRIGTNVPDPVNTLISTSNAYLYVLGAANSNTNGTTNYSYISAYNIVTSPITQLSVISNPGYVAGSDPDCMVEDPTQQFMYTSNRNDGTITGYSFNNTRGSLQDLARGSTFKTNDTGLVCVALSGSVD